MSEQSQSNPMDVQPTPSRLRLFWPVVLGLLVVGGITWFVLYKKVLDADKPTDPAPGRATGMTKAEPGEPGKSDPVGKVDAEFQKASETIDDFFNGLKTSLAYARDGMRSRFALENLKSLSGQVDGLQELVKKLPEAGKSKIVATMRDRLKESKAEAALGFASPGVGGRLKPIVEPMLEKLDAMVK